MKNFTYFMPTKLFVGRGAIWNNKEAFLSLGKKAFIVTGKNSAKSSGALKDVISALASVSIEYAVFDGVTENPSLELAEEAAKVGIREKTDFVIGIGGGSPMDLAKAVACLIKNPSKCSADLLKSEKLDALGLAEIPTTAGTGSETTPYAIFTLHEKKTKQSMAQKLFADIAFIDAEYTMDLPRSITYNTAVDALAHFIESYFATQSNILTQALCECGFRMFADIRKPLYDFKLGFDEREKLLVLASLAGFCIAQTSTTLPHGMGYALTYNKNVPHGKACGVLLTEYLRLCDESMVLKTLRLSGFEGLDDFDGYLRGILGDAVNIGDEELRGYAEDFFSNKAKLNNHPYPLTIGDIYKVYRASCNK